MREKTQNQDYQLVWLVDANLSEYKVFDKKSGKFCGLTIDNLINIRHWTLESLCDDLLRTQIFEDKAHANKALKSIISFFRFKKPTTHGWGVVQSGFGFVFTQNLSGNKTI